MKNYSVALLISLVLAVTSCYDDSQDEYSPDAVNCFEHVTLSAVHFPLRTDGKEKLPTMADSMVNCMKTAFGSTRVNHPVAFDTSYNGVLNYHKTEVPDIFGDGVNREKSFLVKLNHTNEFDFFLYRTETGVEMEGSFYDVLFTVNNKGELINHILAGADETMFMREVIVNGKNSFTIKETTGREENAGPSWSASFQITKHGKFRVTKSEIGLPLTVGDEELENMLMHESSSSFLVVDKKYKRDLEQGIKDQLRAGEAEEAYFEKIGKKEDATYIAVMKVEDGSIVVLVINSPSKNAPTDPDGNYVHRVSTINIKNPDEEPGFTGVDFKDLNYGISNGGKKIDITLQVTQHWQGDENSEVASGDTEKTYEIEFDYETGIKITGEE